MSKLIAAMNSRSGRAARAVLGLGVALVGPALLGLTTGCALTLVGSLATYAALRGHCLLESATTRAKVPVPAD